MASNKFGQRSGTLGPTENVTLTKEQFDEYIKCVNDVEYFTENYVKIRPASGGDLILFALRDYQKTMMQNFGANRFNVCLLPRQSGKTECVVAFILHYVLFNNNKLVAILTNKEKLAKDILGRIKLAYQNLPKWLQQNVMNDNLTSLVMGNGSSVQAETTSKDSLRGTPASLVYMDEMAHVDNNLVEEFYTSVYPTISSPGSESKIIISSTPCGLNLFYKIWTDAINKRNNYFPFEVNWWEIPGRDEAWKQMTLKDIGETKFDQEYGNQFLGSSATLISGKKLRTMTWRAPLKKEDFDLQGNYAIYENPVHAQAMTDTGMVLPEHIYLISVDVSRGQGLDYSAFQVIDITEIPYKQVAKFKHHSISPLIFPTYVIQAARLYNNALVLVEISDIGQQVADIIHYDLEYENLVKIQIKGKLGPQMIDSGAPTKTALGIKTSVATKKLGCANLKTLIEEDKLVVCDDDTVMEFFSFVAKKTSFEADTGKHDDLVMCLVNAAWLFRQDFFREISNGDMRKLLVQEMHLDEDSILPPILMNNDQEEKRMIDKDGTLWATVEPEEFGVDPWSSTTRQWDDWQRNVF